MREATSPGGLRDALCFFRRSGRVRQPFRPFPEKISERGIETRIHSRALELSEGRKKVVFRDEKNGKTFEEAYDALLIATGSVPVIPDIRDISGDNFFVLHALSDGTGIDAYIKKERPRSVCIIGGGYIACEMAETLSRCGMMVTIATRSERFLGRLNKKFRKSSRWNSRITG